MLKIYGPSGFLRAGGEPCVLIAHQKQRLIKVDLVGADSAAEVQPGQGIGEFAFGAWVVLDAHLKPVEGFHPGCLPLRQVSPCLKIDQGFDLVNATNTFCLPR